MRTEADSPRVGAFKESYGFSFDDFQRRACEALAGGSSVLLAAPTGAGKTVVGEFAAWTAAREEGKAFYTTPIKALSNQKYADMCAIHGGGNVGLLTGDNSINPRAPILVMTTEVLRNMIYEDSRLLDDLRFVVLDEVHYLQNPYRGAVWEEVLIHLPVDVQTVSLSATVSNAEEFGEWLQTLRGRVEVIIEEKRPVELRHWYLASDELLEMFVQTPSGEPKPNPRAAELDRRKRKSSRPPRSGRRERQKRAGDGRKARMPLRTEVVARLEAEGMLPAIYFIFSRKGCDQAVRSCLSHKIRLTTAEERARIVEHADMRVADLDLEELEVLGYGEWLEGLSKGIAAHHAGMIPAFKEVVEELFNRGLVKVVFATETLALGINMPARTVVIESLTKFTGETHELMTPGEYTQLAGRAGRRGIDELGHSVVLMQRFVGFDVISRLASTRTYPLRSSFQPSYNMAVNLVRSYDREEAEHLVNSSFGQFQTDRHVVTLERNKEQLEGYLASYRDRMACELGDVEEYRDLIQRLERMEQRHHGSRRRARGARIEAAMTALRAGDVFMVSGGKRRGRYMVVRVTRPRSKPPRLTALSQERSVTRFAPADFREPPVAVAQLKPPEGFTTKDARARRHLARMLSRLEVGRDAPPAVREHDPRELEALRTAVERHPVRACPELGRHLHHADRAQRLGREIRSLDRRIARRTGTLARRFDLVVEILHHLGYVKDWMLTEKGETLTRVYNEADLLVVELLERGVLEPLTPPELAALLSTLVFETRGGEEPAGEMPTDAGRAAYSVLINLWKGIRREEEVRGLELTREPDPGFAERAYRWCDGASLEEVVGWDAPAGDFVRSVKQLVDLLRQLEVIAPSQALSRKVRAALEGLHRGVVAYSSVEF